MESITAPGVEAVSIKNLSKTFVEGRPVLNGVNLALRRGEVHALLGANGSGKSTLIKILAGYHTADNGSQVVVGGVELSLPIDPGELRRAGVRFVHQSQELTSGMTVVDNMRIGGPYFTGFAWKINWKKEKAFALEQFRRLGVEADPLLGIQGLSLTTQAKIAILRALEKSAGEQISVIVLDEPTAALGEMDAAHLIEWIRQIARDEHVGVLFVSHRLPEILAVADELTILRNGEVVAAGSVDQFTTDSIIEAIVGGRIEQYYPERPEATANEVLSVANLSGGSVHDVSFTLKQGEILGLTGIGGSGFEDVPYLLVDKERHTTGTCVIDGEEISLHTLSVAGRVKRGMALVPADRTKEALSTDLTVRENSVLPRLDTFFSKGVLHRSREDLDTRQVMKSVGVVPLQPEMLVGEFSGGNQQKIVLGKWLATSPKVLLLHEPTQGVDVGARSEIFKALAAFAESGGAAVVASVEYEDLANICNRIIVFGHGRAYQELTGAALSVEGVTAASYGADVATSLAGKT